MEQRQQAAEAKEKSRANRHLHTDFVIMYLRICKTYKNVDVDVISKCYTMKDLRAYENILMKSSLSA